MLNANRDSKWTFNTSASTSASVGELLVASLTKGSIKLNSPDGGTVNFGYRSLGVGLGASLGPVGLTISTEDMTSDGSVYIMDTFRGQELSAGDIAGGCVFFDGSASFGGGGSVTSMLFGMDQGKLEDEVTALATAGAFIGAGPLGRQGMGILLDKVGLRNSATGVLMMAGVNVSAIPGGSATGNIGELWVDSVTKPVPKRPDPPGPYPIETKEAKTKDKTVITMTISGEALFCFNDDKINMAAAKVLAQAGKQIGSQASAVNIVGHTDKTGDLKYNIGLSWRRAMSVGKWLIAHGYLKNAVVSYAGMGPLKPLHPSKGDAADRRVEIQIFKK